MLFIIFQLVRVFVVKRADVFKDKALIQTRTRTRAITPNRTCTRTCTRTQTSTLTRTQALTLTLTRPSRRRSPPSLSSPRSRRSSTRTRVRSSHRPRASVRPLASHARRCCHPDCIVSPTRTPPANSVRPHTFVSSPNNLLARRACSPCALWAVLSFFEDTGWLDPVAYLFAVVAF